MSKVVGPLLSLRAHGSFADVIIYQDTRGIQTARRTFAKKDRKSVAQLEIRDLYYECIGKWMDLESWEQQLWNDEAVGQPLSGFNLFVQQYITRTREGLIPYRTPTTLYPPPAYKDTGLLSWWKEGLPVATISTSTVSGFGTLGIEYWYEGQPVKLLFTR